MIIRVGKNVLCCYLFLYIDFKRQTISRIKSHRICEISVSDGDKICTTTRDLSLEP